MVRRTAASLQDRAQALVEARDAASLEVARLEREEQVPRPAGPRCRGPGALLRAAPLETAPRLGAPGSAPRDRPQARLGREGRAVRVLVFGAGATGSLLGAHLFRAGIEVHLVGRTAHVDAIRSGGLVVEGLDGGPFRIPATDTVPAGRALRPGPLHRQGRGHRGGRGRDRAQPGPPGAPPRSAERPGHPGSGRSGPSDPRAGPIPRSGSPGGSRSSARSSRVPAGSAGRAMGRSSSWERPEFREASTDLTPSSPEGGSAFASSTRSTAKSGGRRS